MTPTQTQIDVDDLPSAKPLSEELAPIRAEMQRLVQIAQSLEVKHENDTETMALARETRLSLRDLRIAAEKWRKERKEHHLRASQRIDEAARVIRQTIEPLEKRLLDQEQYAERARERRLAALEEERRRLILEAEGEPQFYRLRELSDVEFDNLLADLRERRQARIDAQIAEDMARQEREARERAEHERIRKEHERLRLEAEARERQEAEERRRQAAIAEEEERQKASLRRSRTAALNELPFPVRPPFDLAAMSDEEFVAFVAAAKVEHAERMEAQRREQEERQKREAAEAELRRQKEAEEARKRAEEERKRAEEEEARRLAAAPDKQKLIAWIEAVRGIPLPECTTPEGSSIVASLATHIGKLLDWLAGQLDSRLS